MSPLKPPFRADHTGSLLRSQAITAARRQHLQGDGLSAGDLKTVEEAEIPALIKMQEGAARKPSPMTRRDGPSGIMISWKCSTGSIWSNAKRVCN